MDSTKKFEPLIKCETCGGTFSRQSSLNDHLKNAKRCRELRDQQNVRTCYICNEIFPSPDALIAHMKEEFDYIEEDQRIQVEELKETQRIQIEENQELIE